MRKMDIGGYQAEALEFYIDTLKSSEAILKVYWQEW